MQQETTSKKLARATLIELAKKKLEPTPDNYRQLYLQLDRGSNDTVRIGPETILQDMARKLPRDTPQLESLARDLTDSSCAGDWGRAQRDMLKFTDQLRIMVSRATKPKAPSDCKGDATLSLTGVAPDIQPEAQSSTAGTEAYKLLAQTLDSGIAGRLISSPALAAEAAGIARFLRESDAIHPDHLRQRLQTLWSGMERLGNQRDKLQSALLDLLRLMIDNVGELVADDQWLRGQIQVVQQSIRDPLSLDALEQARCNLKDIILKQGQLKQGLSEVRTNLKQMIASFIDELGHLSTATGDYHDSVENLSQKIRQTNDVQQLNLLLEEVLRETRNIQTRTLSSRQEVLAARQRVDAAERKIAALETKLQQISEKVHTDFLTGTLNRRGLQEAFEREMAISEREKTPICIALLDIDNFKDLNDNFGHQAGDNVLMHLCTLIKETIRPGDSVARYGGEEFLILLPNADIDQASAVLTRLQRALTKYFFLADDSKVVITFSTGLTRHVPGETQEAAIARADCALYQAKRSGKNRVITLQGAGVPGLPDLDTTARACESLLSA